MAISMIYSQPGTVHTRIEVVQKRQLRMMRFGKRGGWQGAFKTSRPDRPVFPYQRAFRGIIYALGSIDTFLSIGVGTGTALHSVLSKNPEAVLHGVEIDQTVLDVAIQYFQAPSHRQAEYWVGDGCAFLRAKLDMQYDLIFMDAYMRNDIYQPALQPLVLDALMERLSPRGVAVYNIIAQNVLSGSNGRFIDEAKSRFSTVIDLPVGLPLSDQNRLVILSQRGDIGDLMKQGLRQARWLTPFERLFWPVRLTKL